MKGYIANHQAKTHVVYDDGVIKVANHTHGHVIIVTLPYSICPLYYSLYWISSHAIPVIPPPDDVVVLLPPVVGNVAQAQPEFNVPCVVTNLGTHLLLSTYITIFYLQVSK